MGLTMLPEKPIPLRAARDWANYEKRLGTTPLVRKYLLEILKAWVESSKIHNPLALPWVRALVNGDLGFLEKILSDFEDDMGESNVSTLIPDLLPTNAPLQHTYGCLFSLAGEVMTFRKLRELGVENVKKLTTWGDWRADGLTISVKTILDIDRNYQLIEDVVEGLAYLEEYPLVRATSHFQVFNGVGLDDRFMAKVLGFLHADLEEILEHLVSGMGHPRWAYSKVEALRDPDMAGTNEKGRFLVKGFRHHKKVIAELEEIGIGESPEKKHRIKFEIELRQDASHGFATSNDFNAWSGEPEIDREKLGRKIAESLSKIERKNKGKDVSEFAAWINIEAHPSLQAGIAGHPEKIRSLVSEFVEGANFPVLVYIYGGFELAEPVLLQFGPEVEPFSGLGAYS